MSAAEELHNRGVKIEALRAQNAELVAALKAVREAIEDQDDLEAFAIIKHALAAAGQPRYMDGWTRWTITPPPLGVDLDFAQPSTRRRWRGRAENFPVNQRDETWWRLRAALAAAGQPQGGGNEGA